MKLSKRNTAFNSFITEVLIYKNQTIDLQSKTMDWFLYDWKLRNERVKYPFFKLDNKWK